MYLENYFTFLCLCCPFFLALKKEGVGVYCFIMVKLAGNENPLCNSKREKSVWTVDGGSFQVDDIFLPLAQLHIGAALVEGWKLRENIYTLYLYTKT